MAQIFSNISASHLVRSSIALASQAGSHPIAPGPMPFGPTVGVRSRKIARPSSELSSLRWARVSDELIIV